MGLFDKKENICRSIFQRGFLASLYPKKSDVWWIVETAVFEMSIRGEGAGSIRLGEGKWYIPECFKRQTKKAYCSYNSTKLLKHFTNLVPLKIQHSPSRRKDIFIPFFIPHNNSISAFTLYQFPQYYTFNHGFHFYHLVPRFHPHCTHVSTNLTYHYVE